MNDFMFERVRAAILCPDPIKDKLYHITSLIVHIAYHHNNCSLNATAEDLGISYKTARSYLNHERLAQELVDFHLNHLKSEFWFNELDENSQNEHVEVIKSLYGGSLHRDPDPTPDLHELGPSVHVHGV